mgnify:CR=1 FL=1
MKKKILFSSLVCLCGLLVACSGGDAKGSSAIELPQAELAKLDGSKDPFTIIETTDTESAGAQAVVASGIIVSIPLNPQFINSNNIRAPHHDHPAVDIPVPVGSTVKAVVGGTALRISEPGGCGNGLQITRGNTVWLYCHGNGTYYVANGDIVNTGNRIMLSGNSGSSTGPHLHIQVHINGVLRCPQDLLVAAFNGQKYDPQDLPASGCTY